MAVQINRYGATLVKVATISSALAELGFTAEGVQVSFTPFYYDVPGDENGGSEGPPIDRQILGITADIRVDLTKFEQATLDVLSSYLFGGTAGVSPASGTLMFQDGKAFRVVLVPTTGPMNFPRCTLGPMDLNKATKYARPFMTFTAFKLTDGTVWNTTVS